MLKILSKMFILQTLFFGFLCKSLIKEIFLLNLISLIGRKALEYFFLFYFIFMFLYLKNFQILLIFFLLPLIFLLFLLIFLRKREEINLLSQLISLLIPLEARMKLGLSFINAWQKGLEELKLERTRVKIQKVTEILKFQTNFSYPDKEIENFIKDLMIIHQSSNPLKRLKHLKRKIKIEQSFHIKSKRALLQVRIQSIVLCVFYFGLLAWTIIAYGSKYTQLIVISFLLFFIGLFWIFKIGRKMKWSV